MKTLHTLEVEQATVDGKQVTLQVNYDKDFMIHEVFAWSEYFNDFVPVQLLWIQKYRKFTWELIEQSIRSHHEDLLAQKNKDRELAVYLGK